MGVPGSRPRHAGELGGQGGQAVAARALPQGDKLLQLNILLQCLSATDGISWITEMHCVY